MGRFTQAMIAGAEAHDRVLVIADAPARVAFGARAAWTGARGLAELGAKIGRNARAEIASGTYDDRPLTISGAELYHSVGDRERALDQLATDFASLQNDIMTQAGWRADPYHPAEGPLFDWYRANVEPTIAEWQTFHGNQTGSWAIRWATDWSVYEQWQDRLKRIRELATAHGVQLASPAPVDLPKTVWQRGAEGVGSGAAALFTLLKVAVYAAIGITGFVALYAVFRDIRGRGQHP